jgi:putative NADH-flavin reductase
MPKPDGESGALWCHGSLGGALMAELLRRQHEVIAILDDLNVLAPRPGLRKAAICSMPSGSSKA